MTSPVERYVAFEGVEGSGKSTVVSAVSAALSADGEEVVTVREPGGTDLGEELRHVLLHAGDMSPWAEAALFAAGRAQLVQEVIRPALASGSWVLSDRSYYSSMAYQGGGRGLGIEAIRGLNRTVLDGVEPGLVVLLSMDVAAGLERQDGTDRIGGEGLAFQQAVAGAYEELANAEPHRVKVVDAERPLDEVVGAVLDLLGIGR